MQSAFAEYRSPETAALSADICTRALDARDPRFDGLFFVGITSTRVYCRPVCPARVAYPSHRRFFDTAAAAECAGFRPCLRCRPELAPGRAMVDAVSRLASAAAHRIEAGALNGRSVADLARELGVSDRHLRRAVERELGVSPLELAQTYRLLLAKRLLADTALSVTRVAYASGFQSLRRFNAVFRERYRMPPSTLRRSQGVARAAPPQADHDFLRLTLAYRAPLAWTALIAMLRRDATPGVEIIEGRRYGRTVNLNGCSGVVFVEDAAQRTMRSGGRTSNGAAARQTHVNIDVSSTLLPVLMPLLARLRQLLDLDSEPLAVDTHLAQGGLGALVRRRPGLRLPGAMDGFEIALRTLIGDEDQPAAHATALAHRVATTFGTPIDTALPALTHLAATAERVTEAGAPRLTMLGMSRSRATSIVSLARRMADGVLRMQPGGEPGATHDALMELGIGDRLATTIVMRALHWPDAFPASDVALQRAADTPSASALLARSERWRPWRAYAALHLRLQHDAS
jgi:AraC family transcriptional regulator of adaptative response / DNA-3-methyladenine glycosylase II